MMIYSLIIIVLWVIHAIDMRRYITDDKVPIKLYYLAIFVIVINQIGWVAALKM
ncbi:hypothetical protein ACS127_17365 [Amphibacillus sp. Q70]|uniref:hypothetical protein n=1 Tax=Amphibacillus sp. Q70 TaxID=3453416 RepID=UPI003F84F26E